MIFKITAVFGLFLAILISGFFMTMEVAEYLENRYNEDAADDFKTIMALLAFAISTLFIVIEASIIVKNFYS